MTELIVSDVEGLVAAAIKEADAKLSWQPARHQIDFAKDAIRIALLRKHAEDAANLAGVIQLLVDKDKQLSALRHKAAEDAGELVVATALLGIFHAKAAEDAKRIGELDSIPTNWELSYSEVDGDRSELEWQVHQINGGYNDREWTLIGRGEKPSDAIRAALNGANGNG